MKRHKKHIVIVGGGFGGIKTALELAKDKQFDITLLSDRDHFLYYPALYGTATGHSHRESSVPLDDIFDTHKNISVKVETAVSIDEQRKIIICKSGKEYQYDKAVFALGVVTNYFGIPGLAENTYGIKSIDEVNHFKEHLHAELVSELHLDKRYIVIGAGPTGVELSAALGAYLRQIATLHNVPHDRIHIDLIEANPRVLPRMSERASRLVAKRLRRLGVTVMTNSRVEAADDGSLTVNGKRLLSESIVWTSGVSNNAFFAANQHAFELAQNGRVVVNDYMQAGTHIYVIGDNAATQYSGLAQTALHDALYVADDIRRRAEHKPVKAYAARKPPVVVPVGDNWAIFEWYKLTFAGYPASLIREAADVIGYSDVLPIGRALGAWRAQRIREDNCVVCDGQA